MLSILIPTYNYTIFPLVSELNMQCVTAKINFEIIVLDDFSSISTEENREINKIPNCEFYSNSENLGRTQNRNILAKKAKYDWLLFLDADVIPVESTFISKYISSITTESKVIIGGYQYKSNFPKQAQLLRYVYGKSREEKLASVKNKKPYSSVFSGNILILKDVFESCNYQIQNNFYGMDIYFAYQLFINKINVLHIDNGIFHLGLESNEIFFEKSLQSVKTRKNLLEAKYQIEQINPLLSKYKTLKKYRLNGIIYLIFKLVETHLKNKILNKKPNLFYFDLYRLGYLCSLDYRDK